MLDPLPSYITFTHSNKDNAMHEVKVIFITTIVTLLVLAVLQVVVIKTTK